MVPLVTDCKSTSTERRKAQEFVSNSVLNSFLSDVRITQGLIFINSYLVNIVLSSMVALPLVIGPVDVDPVVEDDAISKGSSVRIPEDTGYSGQAVESSMETEEASSSAFPANMATTRNMVGRFSGDDCTHITAVSSTLRTSTASLGLTWSLGSITSISLSSLCSFQACATMKNPTLLLHSSIHRKVVKLYKRLYIQSWSTHTTKTSKHFSQYLFHDLKAIILRLPESVLNFSKFMNWPTYGFHDFQLDDWQLYKW